MDFLCKTQVARDGTEAQQASLLQNLAQKLYKRCWQQLAGQADPMPCLPGIRSPAVVFMKHKDDVHAHAQEAQSFKNPPVPLPVLQTSCQVFKQLLSLDSSIVLSKVWIARNLEK